MSAICGIIESGRPVRRDILEKMSRLMRYRGPDNQGFWYGKEAGFAHRLLSSLSSKESIQPLTSEKGNILLLCDGEIYNFKELRKMLKSKGHTFSSSSDNEVILHLYEEKGEACASFLRGTFAFAIWDIDARKLLLCRDHFGKKPLVYAELKHGILFASELKALLAHPDLSRTIDHQALDGYITFQAVPAPHTIFSDIKKVPSASFLVWHQGTIRIEQYWQLNFTEDLSLSHKKEYQELMWATLQETVKLQTSSGSAPGVFLSGGIDSSAIAAILNAASTTAIKTFSVGFEEESFNELHYAKKVANHLHTDHHELIVKPDIISLLPKLVWHYNEPFGDSSMIPTYCLSQETKKLVTVALNGDGGDEALGGYTRYWQTLLLSGAKKIPRKFLHLARTAGHAIAKKYGDRFFEWLDDAAESGEWYAYARRLSCFSRPQKQALYSKDLLYSLKEYDAYTLAKKAWSHHNAKDTLSAMLYTDYQIYLSNVLLVKMDIATMAHGLESRSPFLDPLFVETLAKFPSSLKIGRFTTKYLLKKKVRGLLPPEIIRRKKMGFGIPINIWMKKEYRNFIQDILLDGRVARRSLFNRRTIETMVIDHLTEKESHTTRLWLLLNLELWYRIFVDGEEP
ncbi:MAG: asparagine synthase (glutamine-hydrolyzing) [Candidatus Ratteibacteria bacterium]